tara:strand:+ start:98 stop:508 length:411 start_codon:yes stop_codon:yes gene_type:complete
MNLDLAMWLGIILSLSIGVNIFLFWYLRRLLAKFIFISGNLNDLVKMINVYQNHLKQVYSMEMFYGDETLEHLMTHTRDLSEILKDYEDVYSISMPLEPDEENEDYDTEENPDEKANPPQIDQENVFYAGSRKRNS